MGRVQVKLGLLAAAFAREEAMERRPAEYSATVAARADMRTAAVLAGRSPEGVPLLLMTAIC
jgi:hypothetical protein